MQTSLGQASPSGPGPFPTIRADAASAPNTANTNTANSATVSADDFLQLLVTEMKNQDPTANTDPNEYISQLVQVNSLEQLVQINQDLGGSSSPSSNHGASGAFRTATEDTTTGAARKSAATASGNLAEPGESPAAVRVAQALQFPATGVSSTRLQNSSRISEPDRGTAGTVVSQAR